MTSALMWKIMFTYSSMISNVEGAGFSEIIIRRSRTGKCGDVMLSIKILSLSAMYCLFFAGVGWIDLSGDVDRLRKDFKSVDTAYGLVFAYALIHNKNLAAHHGFCCKESFMYNTFPNVSNVLRLHIPNFTKLIYSCKTRNYLGSNMHAGKTKKYTPFHLN